MLMPTQLFIPQKSRTSGLKFSIGARITPARKSAEALFNVPDLTEEEEKNGGDFFGDVRLAFEETVGCQRDREKPEDQAHQTVKDNLFLQRSGRYWLHFLFLESSRQGGLGRRMIQPTSDNLAFKIAYFGFFIKENLYS